MARAGTTARVKSFKAYTVEEAAEVVGVTRQTIRAWIRQGLVALTEKRPTLIMGWALKDFLGQARVKRRVPLHLGEFFCLRCKAAEKPALGYVEYTPKSNRSGTLKAFCGSCEGPCVRMVSRADLPEWRTICDLADNSGRTA